jgi:hypothetical protein
MATTRKHDGPEGVPLAPGELRRRVKVTNAVNNGENIMYHAVHAYVLHHGPADDELDGFRALGLSDSQALTAWTLQYMVNLDMDTAARAIKVQRAAENSAIGLEVPEFTLTDLQAFAMWTLCSTAGVERIRREHAARNGDEPRPKRPRI